MATYFPGSNNQKHAARMLYPKDNLPSSYAEAPICPENSMMYMTYASTSGSYSDTSVANSQPQNGCTTVANFAGPDSNPSQQEILSNLGGSQIGFDEFSSWKNGRNEVVLMHPKGVASDVLQGAQTLQGQGLSLSLATNVSPGFQISSLQYNNSNLGVSSFSNANQLFLGKESGKEVSFADNVEYQSKRSRQAEYRPTGFPEGIPSAKTYISPCRMSSIARTLSNSKYLKVVQQLLDEVVNVRDALERNSRKPLIEVDGESKEGNSDPPENGASANPQDSNSDYKSELSTTEKQELQSKLTKLLSVLDEVDSRYKQYYHQIEILVSSFDVVAGSGAAKPYTAVALRTISRHFRCLRDAIKGQILMTRKNLGEQDASSNIKGVGISRLRYVDQQLRQQKAIQQFGVLQQHAWRPQRGLPENAVTVLRAWLFEHFLHPYPKDSDKSILARETGLTRSQVSNWFINARVRLWKPMVEEMYREELGNAELDPVASKATKHDTKTSEDRGEDIQQTSTSPMEQCKGKQSFRSKSARGCNSELGGPNENASLQNASNTKTQNERDTGKTRDEESTCLDGCRPTFCDSTCQSDEVSDRFIAAASAAYDMSELERFGTGDGVSLTLRLQQHDEGSLPISLAAHHSFVTMRGDDGGYNTASPSVRPETADFDCTDSGDRQHHFGPSQLLHDFVA